MLYRVVTRLQLLHNATIFELTEPPSRRMRMSNNVDVRKAKETYLPGMMVRLVKMDDAQTPVVGTEGTVFGVDDIGYC